MHLKAGNSTPENSLKKAKEQYAELLPQGLATPNNYFYTITGTEQLGIIGMCWFSLEPRQGQLRAYVYDVYLVPSVRGKGLGRLVIAEMESCASSRGALKIELMVFGENTTARSLYEKCGFLYTTMYMAKSLG